MGDQEARKGSDRGAAWLQYRMFASKPTFMSSNYSVAELEQHLAEVKDSLNQVNASRVVERIKELMKEIRLDDVNYRK